MGASYSAGAHSQRVGETPNGCAKDASTCSSEQTNDSRLSRPALNPLEGKCKPLSTLTPLLYLCQSLSSCAHLLETGFDPQCAPRKRCLTNPMLYYTPRKDIWWPTNHSTDEIRLSRRICSLLSGELPAGGTRTQADNLCGVRSSG